MNYIRALDQKNLPPESMKIVRIGAAEVVLIHTDGKITALGNTCVHKGGPLGKGRLKRMEEGCFIACPWHGYEYHVESGKAPGGYQDRASVYGVKIDNGGIFVSEKPVERSHAAPHPDDPLADLRSLKYATQPDSLNVLGISATNMNAGNERFSTSEFALNHALESASREHTATIRRINLRDIPFRACEGYYSIHERACTWPCSITESDPSDGMTEVYRAMILWADIVLLATPIRWGNASSLYYRMAERLNCVQNQITLRNKILIRNKVAGFIITGGQDNIQQVAGQLSTFFSEIGFTFPPFNFVGWSRGWVAEDMEENVREFRDAGYVRRSAEELVTNCVSLSRRLKHEHAETKGTPLPNIGESPSLRTSKGSE